MGTSAAALCLGGLLAACGSGGDGGYAAVGAADGSPRASGAVVAPSGEVSLAPLDGTNPTGGKGSSGAGERSSAAGPGGGTPTGGTGDADGSHGSSPGSGGSTGSAAGGGGSGTASGSAGGTGTGTGGGSSSSSGSPSGGDSGGDSGRTGGSSGGSSGGSGGSSTPSSPGPTASARPAALAVSEPSRTATGQRWCEKVTLSFSNTGGTAVRSGTVTFGTHIIGALGIDWATVRSTEPLPAPIAAGGRKGGTWTVCVDSWRVPLGMHVETQDVSVAWK
ncbi:hypothetical protein ACFRIC_11480 [Streptomyces sp. NPDC056738]|uniref:hypothetical protein n=1 Tax=Streptomyces sp. NPDC056738 TaxID=3345933 RepID=UPI003682E8A0